MSNRWQMQGSYVWSRLDGDQLGITTSSTTSATTTSPTRTTCSTRRPGPRRQRSAARLQAARQLPGAVGHQHRRELPGAERPAARSHAERARSRRARAACRSRSAAPIAPTSLNLLSLRADKGVPLRRATARRSSPKLHNVLNSSAGQSSYGTLTQNFANQAAFDAARADDVLLRPRPGDRRAARAEARVPLQLLGGSHGADGA